MINLFNDDYGIGVQGNTTYFRSAFNDFQFYKGGTHNNLQGDSGGGTKLLTISGTGQTTVHGDLHVNGSITSANFGIGMVAYFVGTTPPTGWLECNGQSIPNSGAYTTLYNMLGTTYGTSGSDRRVPDFRGYFLRGWHNGVSGPNPSNASNLGSPQYHEVKSHNHTQDSHRHNLDIRWDQYGDGNGNTFAGRPGNTNGDDEGIMTHDTSSIYWSFRMHTAQPIYIHYTGGENRQLIIHY